MKDKKKIQQEVGQLGGFLTLTRVYTELASTRMRKTRDNVLQNRQFLASINDVFTDVRVSYAREVLQLGKRKTDNSGNITFLSHNGKTVAMFLSANTGLYGDIIDNTFRLFLKELKDNPEMEVTLVGKLGYQYFTNQMAGRPFTYFDLSDVAIAHDQLSDIIKHLVQYEEIRVYYPAYQSAVSQKASRYSISAETPIAELSARDEKSVYIFEPNLKEILIFFEKEIFASLLDQTIRESQLAKFAARIMALDRAGENIKEELKKLNLLASRVRHVTQNKKQNDSLVSQFV